MKIKFYCNICMEDFQIQSKYLISKSSINCPNCDSEFPSDSFKQLKQGISSIVDSRACMQSEETRAGYTNRFDFKIID